MKDTYQEIGIAVALLALLVFFLNPLGLWMPDALVMMMALGLVVVFAVFAGFIWREHTRDERELLHRMIAGRVAYLVGAGVLVVGIVLQSLSHTLDPWLILTLGAMVLAKIIGIAHSRTHR
jgi:hypothetical protein